MKQDEISIAGRRVGAAHPVYVIAEAGVNHNGDESLARALVTAAARAGADAVKFQTWVTDKLIAPDAPLAEYQDRNTAGRESQYEMLRRLELSYDAFRRVREFGAASACLVFSTPDEEDSADFLAGLGVPVFKIGSAEVTNTGFLAHVARKGRPVILSTGMATLGEVERAVRTIEEAGNDQLVLLHCVSNYPCEPAECNLRAMDTMRDAFGYPVGFSDHSLGSTMAIAAVARGACVIEKHLTLDTRMPGPDHAASLDPDQFAAMVEAIRHTEAALGSGRKEPTPSEVAHRPLMRKRWVACRPLAAGTRIAREDLALRRATPDGFDPSEIDLLIDRELSQPVPAWGAITRKILR
jgi:N-acetylneuraminate synthase